MTERNVHDLGGGHEYSSLCSLGDVKDRVSLCGWLRPPVPNGSSGGEPACTERRRMCLCLSVSFDLQGAELSRSIRSKSY